MDLLVAAVVLDHPLHRALRDARTDIVDQPRHHLGMAGVDQRLGHQLGQPLAAGHGQRVLHGVGADDPHQILVAEHGAALEDRIGDLDRVAGELARDVWRQPGARRHRARPGPAAPRRARSRTSSSSTAVGYRPVGRAAQLVELAPELGRDLGTGLGRAVALQDVDIRGAQPLLALPVRMVAQERLAPAPAHRCRRDPAHLVPTTDQSTLHHRNRLAT